MIAMDSHILLRRNRSANSSMIKPRVEKIAAVREKKLIIFIVFSEQ